MANLTYIEDPEPRELTTSTYKVITCKGSHNFRIQNYSYLKDMDAGKFISSEVFSVGGHLWEIQFFPKGKEKDQIGDICVSIFVNLVSKCEKDLTTWFEYYFLDQEGGRWHRSDGKFVEMKMNKRCMYGPYSINKSYSPSAMHYCDRTSLGKCFVRDDCFTIQCSVVVENGGVSETLAQPIIPLSDLKQSYEQLLESKEGIDISFEVDGEIFYAHRIILSTRSPVFKAQFFGALKADDNTQSIKIEEMQAPVFKTLLHFIYCDVIPDKDLDCEGTVMKQHLLTAADRYGIQTLKSLCESLLWEDIAIDDVASTLALAEQHSCSQLKSRCLEFIGLPKNLQAVMQTDGFEKLNVSCPAVICELLKYVAMKRSFV